MSVISPKMINHKIECCINFKIINHLNIPHLFYMQTFTAGSFNRCSTTGTYHTMPYYVTQYSTCKLHV